MNAKQAKDFLVTQTAEQATLDGVSLDDLEKRMMYFSESDTTAEDPGKLNDEFESKRDPIEYEAKVSKLLHRAYRRLKGENPSDASTWDEAIRTLRKGDHYILVMWDSITARERPPHDTLKLVGTALVIVAVSLILIFTYARFEPQITKYTDRIPRLDGRIIAAGLALLFILALLPVNGSNAITKIILRIATRSKSGKL